MNIHLRRVSTYPGGPVYKISHDLSSDYRKCIVRSTYDSDLKRAKIYFRNIVKLIYECYLRLSYNFASESYLRKALLPS